MAAPVLVLAGIPDSLTDAIASEFGAVDARELGVDGIPARVLGRVRAIACTGRAMLGRSQLARLPELSVVSSYSAGLDGIDEAALRERNIALFNTSHALADAVADLAFGSILMLTRRIVQADRFVRAGEWKRQTFPLSRSLEGLRVGILGFGHIGKAIARRCGFFGIEVAYTATRQHPARVEKFIASVQELAGWGDLLVVACASNPDTRGIVGSTVLDALGTEGLLVNVARGAIVDEDALESALRASRIAGAALDVFSAEPAAADRFIDLPNVVLTPHIGSATTQTRERMAGATLDALRRHLAQAHP